MSNNDTQLLLRLPVELKAELKRAAFANGRTVTAEANMRLQASIHADSAQGDAYRTKPAVTRLDLDDSGAPQKSPADALTRTDQAMLAIFRRLPPEKQLALLSLFK